MNIKKKISDTILSTSKYMIHLNTDAQIEKILNFADFAPIENHYPTQCKTIIFVTPFMRVHGGGLTSVLRIAKRLSSYDLSVYFSCPEYDDCLILNNNSHSNLPGYQTNYITWNEAKKIDFDFVIPVEDMMVYYAKQLHGHMVYFVQDYEPYFNPVGDKYYLSKKAYEQKEDIISLGEWNLNEIRRNIDADKLGQLFSVEFPFEKGEYTYTERNFEKFKTKNKLSIAVYIKREPKRIPGIVMNMLRNANSLLSKQGKQLDVYYFGLHKVEKPKFGKNLGIISKQEIDKLYSHCDFGMVASMTNVSLVPYEMISAGLPVIEFMDGSYPQFLGLDSAILLDNFDYKELASKIEYYVENPTFLAHINAIAYKKIQQYSWDNTGRQFYEILKSMVK